MDTKIKARFWRDPQVELLPAEGKLALLWLFSAHISDCGYVECSPKRFEFETGSPWQALLDATEALGESIARTSKGFLCKNYVREQLGEGEGLARNNMTRSVMRAFRACPPDVREIFLETYPELEALAKPFTSPSCVSGRAGEERRGEENAEGGPGETSPPEFSALSVSEQAERIVSAYVRRDAPMECHAAVLAAIASGQQPAHMLASVRECAALIRKHAPHGAMNSKVPRAKTFFLEQQWNDPLVFQHRWEVPEKKEGGAPAVPSSLSVAPSRRDLAPPSGWEEACQNLFGFTYDEWSAVPVSAKDDIRDHLAKLRAA